MADKMISQVKLYHGQIKEKFRDTETVTLNLEIDPQIQCMLNQRSHIGKLICRKERESLPTSRAEVPLKECQVEMEVVVEIKRPDDKRPAYTGITYLQGDEIMLADKYNKRVLLLDSSYQYVSSFTLPDRPGSICVADRQEVAVSIPNQKIVQFLSVTSGNIKPTTMVQTRYKCYGVASVGNGKIVVSGDCQDKDKYCWSLIASTGEVKCHQFECKCDLSLTNVALNSSCTRVYITVYWAGSLYCFDMDGRMMYKYCHDNLTRSAGVATDRDDNVYVVGRGSNNIHKLTSDGTPIRIISVGIPKYPRAICFNKSREKFLITNDSENRKIYRFGFK